MLSIFIFSTDVTRHLSVLLPAPFQLPEGPFCLFMKRIRLFMKLSHARKRLSVAACNESVVAKSNLTFKLRDEPAGEVTTREAAELVTSSSAEAIVSSEVSFEVTSGCSCAPIFSHLLHVGLGPLNTVDSPSVSS